MAGDLRVFVPGACGVKQVRTSYASETACSSVDPLLYPYIYDMQISRQ